MMIWKNPLREELLCLFSSLSLRRAPALRRSSRADWLFASDLPACAAPEDCSAFLCLAGASGWECLEDRGWLYLRKAGLLLPAAWFAVRGEGEAACLGSLYARHPGRTDADETVFRLMKAREEGFPAWEKACRSLHLECAGRLRQGLPLPRIFSGDPLPAREEDGLKGVFSCAD